MPLNGYNLTHAKKKLLRRWKGVHEHFSSRLKSQKSFTLTVPWNLAKLRGDLSWNRCTSTPHRIGKKWGFAERASAQDLRKGLVQYCLQSGLDEKWWADSMEFYCYLQNIQDLLSDGKTPYERRFGVPFFLARLFRLE